MQRCNIFASSKVKCVKWQNNLKQFQDNLRNVKCCLESELWLNIYQNEQNYNS